AQPLFFFGFQFAAVRAFFFFVINLAAQFRAWIGGDDFVLYGVREQAANRSEHAIDASRLAPVREALLDPFFHHRTRDFVKAFVHQAGEVAPDILDVLFGRLASRAAEPEGPIVAIEIVTDRRHPDVLRIGHAPLVLNDARRHRIGLVVGARDKREYRGARFFDVHRGPAADRFLLLAVRRAPAVQKRDRAIFLPADADAEAGQLVIVDLAQRGRLVACLVRRFAFGFESPDQFSVDTFFRHDFVLNVGRTAETNRRLVPPFIAVHPHSVLFTQDFDLIGENEL
ncbi:MAG TPA: hypothetical protein VN289_18895, partial [Paraburkholderia sp.]|nr:hypothetical protein [Paraburkholderia sp.]